MTVVLIGQDQLHASRYRSQGLAEHRLLQVIDHIEQLILEDHIDIKRARICFTGVPCKALPTPEPLLDTPRPTHPQADRALEPALRRLSSPAASAGCGAGWCSAATCWQVHAEHSIKQATGWEPH